MGVSNASFMISSIIFSVLSDSVKMSLNHVSVCFLRFHQWSLIVVVSPFGSTVILDYELKGIAYLCLDFCWCVL